MDVDVVYLFKLGVYLAGFSALIFVSVILFQIVQIMGQVKRIMDRIELMTDVKGMFGLIRKVVSRKKDS